MNRPINVFGCEDKSLNIFPLRISEIRQQDDEIDLLMLNKDDNNHYVYIKDINVLLTRGDEQEGEFSTT